MGRGGSQKKPKPLCSAGRLYDLNKSVSSVILLLWVAEWVRKELHVSVCSMLLGQIKSGLNLVTEELLIPACSSGSLVCGSEQ